MQKVTINTNNFDRIEYLVSNDINSLDCYVTKAEDRNGNKGALLFIPTSKPDGLIWTLR